MLLTQKINLRSLHLAMFRQIVFAWLFSVIFIELVFCTPDVHRIVLKTPRRTRDRDHYKSHSSDHRNPRKPVVHDAHEDDWLPVTTRRPHQQFNSYRLHQENENKRGKPRNRTTSKPINIANAVEFTTAYPEKLPIPIIESIYNNYQIANNSLDLQPPNEVARFQKFNVKGKVRQHREKETTTSKIQSNGYEVYEEIIGDLLPPPPPPRLNINVLPSVNSLPLVSTSIAPITTVTTKEEENHIKQNVTNPPVQKNKPYGRRTKARRTRGNAKFDEVHAGP